MTRYRHIPGKERWRLAVSRCGWQAWIVKAAADLQQFLVRQPAALRVCLRYPIFWPRR